MNAPLHSDLERLAADGARLVAIAVEDVIVSDTVHREDLAERLDSFSSWEAIAPELAFLARARTTLGDRLTLPPLVALAVDRSA